MRQLPADPKTIFSREVSPYPPSVTVIMPIRNEASFIERSLGAVLTQEYPHDQLEVLIADGMSTDETRDVIDRLAKANSTVRLQSSGADNVGGRMVGARLKTCDG